MESYSRRSISDDLTKYDYLAKEDDFIEVCEWKNGEGFDITFKDKMISLSFGQLEAIQYLINSLQYKDK